jgi:hypothetical protein
MTSVFLRSGQDKLIKMSEDKYLFSLNVLFQYVVYIFIIHFYNVFSLEGFISALTLKCLNQISAHFELLVQT